MSHASADNKPDRQKKPSKQKKSTGPAQSPHPETRLRAGAAQSTGIAKEARLRASKLMEAENIKKAVKDCDLLLLAYILKTTTNEDSAMSVAKISQQLDALIPASDEADDSYFPDRTLRRRLGLFSFLETADSALLQKINKLIPFILGGQITAREVDGIMSGKNTTSSGKQRRFYFEPVLSPGDMDLIWGSVQCNRYLSSQEKEYLLSRLRVLLPDYRLDKDQLENNTYRHISELETLPCRPPRNKSAILPMDSQTLLANIQTLHEAIAKELQVELVYGTYDISKDSRKVGFHPRSTDRPNVLNPYALMWNKGGYYLIATHDKYTNPVHYRVDRMISVRIHSVKNIDGELEEVKRSKIPQTLAPFFDKRSGSKPEFNSIKYANTYPGMKIYGESNKIDVIFECTPISLQILIDNFGPSLILSPSPISHDKSEVDINGKEQTFLSAKIKGVQYENALRFAISHSEYLTLLGPEPLVEEVGSTLRKIAQKYTHD